MFDYVIVGAGSAGCVLAARLSKDLSVKVALIEAGAGPAITLFTDVTLDSCSRRRRLTCLEARKAYVRRLPHRRTNVGRFDS